MIITENEKEEWLKNYVNAQLKEFNDRYVDVVTQLDQAQIEVDNLTKDKVKYETIIYVLKTVQKNIIHYPSVEQKEAKQP